jgi:hypothetical protein
MTVHTEEDQDTMTTMIIDIIEVNAYKKWNELDNIYLRFLS